MTSRAVRGCAPISAPGTAWFQKASGPFAASPHPPPAEMNPPANRLAHRHRSAAAGAEITLVVGRRGEFARSKITVKYLVVGVARHATADCTLRTDDLLAFARNQHVCSLLRPAHLDLVGDGRRRSVGSKLAAGGFPRRTSVLRGVAGVTPGRLGRSREPAATRVSLRQSCLLLTWPSPAGWFRPSASVVRH